MPKSVFIGEFEQLVLLAILHLENDAGALALRSRMNALAGRSISRGALYRTLDRLEAKGWVAWTLDDTERPERGGHPSRHFRVTRQGITALRASRATLLSLWDGLERVLR
ncbi:MAG TPA: helix-turn-helix transcriptional regulator [Vicinamibacterales bacterium]|nr:helix-turn-helix transcriptional regulator [Vicinamibacterales bacterium]